MAIYLGRRCKSYIYGDDYELGLYKKDFDIRRGFIGESMIDSFCPVDFERITGIKLKPGEIKKVKRIVIELEE